MRTCPRCERVMDRTTDTGAIVFRCFCGVEVPGGPADARLAGAAFRSSGNAEKFRRVIENAAFDPAALQVRGDCPGALLPGGGRAVCGRDYLTQVRVGEQETAYWVCPCGWQGSAHPGGGAPL